MIEKIILSILVIYAVSILSIIVFVLYEVSHRDPCVSKATLILKDWEERFEDCFENGYSYLISTNYTTRSIGKTTLLVKLALKHNFPILVSTVRHYNWLKHMVWDNFGTKIEILKIHDLHNQIRGRRTDFVLVDEEAGMDEKAMDILIGYGVKFVGFKYDSTRDLEQLTEKYHLEEIRW